MMSGVSPGMTPSQNVIVTDVLHLGSQAQPQWGMTEAASPCGTGEMYCSAAVVAAAMKLCQQLMRALYRSVRKEMQICQRHSLCHPFMGSLVGGIRHKHGKILITCEIKVHSSISLMVILRKIYFKVA